MIHIDYIKLTGNDSDIPHLLEIHTSPEISKYISIDKDNFFDYVISTDNVSFYKIKIGDSIVGCLDTELNGDTLYVSILTVPKHQRKGIATRVIDDLKSYRLISGFTRIIAAIDKSNTSSIGLFEKSDFIPIAEFDELIEYEWKK